jgi:corrinoid protein of di/trimethylamine methyltransferase
MAELDSSQNLIKKIQQAIIDGETQETETYIHQALDAGVPALEVLHSGIMTGADVVGKKFEAGEYFLPELMLTGRALKAAMNILTPALQAQDQAGVETGIVVMATIQTDIHDIGKNMVASMLSAAGLQVIDLGVDVPIKEIISRAQSHNADVIGISALLTTSLPFMQDLINLLDAMGQRQRFKVMVGGASVTPAVCQKIGADGTAPNAVEAVRLARRLIEELRQERGG